MSRSAFPAMPGANRAASRAAVAIAVASIILVALAPVMWAANRSTPLVLALAGLAVLTAQILAGTLPDYLGRLRKVAFGPIGLALAGFLAWALLSLLWSHRPASGLAMYGELLVSLVAGVVVALGWPGAAPRWALRGLGWSLVLAGLLIAAELRLGTGLRGALGLRNELFVFNRPILTCLLLAAPALHGLWSAPGGGRGDRVLAILAGASVIAAIMVGESGAAKLGAITLAAIWLLALAAPRLALLTVGLGFFAMMAIAPVLGPVADRILPAGLYQQLSRAHARDRVDIWLSFGEAIRARPLTGSGFGTSAALSTHRVAAKVSAPRRPLLDVGHPHNAALQIWVETGFIGVVLLSAAALAFLAGLRQMTTRDRAPRLAVAAAALAVASVGHGAWQGWWIAALGAAAIWFMSIARQQAETGP